jgi:hypothetical protein
MAVDFGDDTDVITTNGWDDNYTQLTVMGWIRIDTDQNGYFFIKNNELEIFLDGTFAGNTMRMYHRRHATGGGSNDGEWATAVDSIKQSTLYHFAMSHDASDFPNNDGRMFLNGVEDTNEISTPAGSLVTNANDYRIASDNVGNNSLAGPLADFRVYSRALSPEEISTIHAARGGDMILEGLEVRHMLDEGVPGGSPGTGSVVDLSPVQRSHSYFTFSAAYAGNIFGLSERRRQRRVAS